MTAMIAAKPRAAGTAEPAQVNQTPMQTMSPASTAVPTPPPGNPSAASKEEVETLKKKLDEMSRQMAKMAEALQRLDALDVTIQKQGALMAMPGKNAWNPRESFKCGACHSAGLVAVHVKCTSCGKETWTGWWPRKK